MVGNGGREVIVGGAGGLVLTVKSRTASAPSSPNALTWDTRNVYAPSMRPAGVAWVAGPDPSRTGVSLSSAKTPHEKPGWSPVHENVGLDWLVRPPGPPVMVGAAGALGLMVNVRAWPVPPPPLPALSTVRTYHEIATRFGITVGHRAGSRVARYSACPGTKGSWAILR